MRERIEEMFRSGDPEMAQLALTMCHKLRINYYVGLVLFTQLDSKGNSVMRHIGPKGVSRLYSLHNMWRSSIKDVTGWYRTSYYINLNRSKLKNNAAVEVRK